MNNNMKNIIILKNLPSNIIDEAIVILKQNKKIKKTQMIENIAKNNLNNSEKNKPQDNFALKEAECVISDYISKIENQDLIGYKKENKLKEKYKKLKILSILLFCAMLFFIILNFI